MSVAAAVLSVVTAAGVCSVPDRCTLRPPLLLLGCSLTCVHLQTGCFDCQRVNEAQCSGRRPCAVDGLTGISKVVNTFTLSFCLFLLLF